MPASVRTARLSDVTGILALYRELRPTDPEIAEPAVQAAFEGVLNSENLELIVCEEEMRLVATCMLAVVPSLAMGARPFAVVEHVVTLNEFRRKGFGQMVLEYALSAAWSKGCYKVLLLSGAQRTQAHRLYESVGFLGDVERGFVAKPPNAV